MSFLKKLKKYTNPANALKNTKKAVSGAKGKKIIRTIHKYEGRVVSVAAPVAGALFLGPVGAAAGTAIGTGARYYGEKQGALAKGRKGSQVKKAGRRGIKAGLIIGGSVTGASVIGAIAGVGSLTSGPLLGGASAAAPAAAAAAPVASVAAPAAAAGGGVASTGGIVGGLGAVLGAVGKVLSGGGKVTGAGPAPGDQAGGQDGTGSGGGFLGGTAIDPATPEGQSRLGLLLAAAAVAVVFLVR